MRFLFLCLAGGLVLGAIDAAARAWAATCSDIDIVSYSKAECCVPNCGYDDLLAARYRDNTGQGSLLCEELGASNNVYSWDSAYSGNCGNATGAPDGKTTGSLYISVIREDECMTGTQHTTVASFGGLPYCPTDGSTHHTFNMGMLCCSP